MWLLPGVGDAELELLLLTLQQFVSEDQDNGGCASLELTRCQNIQPGVVEVVAGKVEVAEESWEEPQDVPFHFRHGEIGSGTDQAQNSYLSNHPWFRLIAEGMRSSDDQPQVCCLPIHVHHSPMQRIFRLR